MISPESAALDVRGLTVMASGRPAIRNLTFQVPRGAFGAIVGPNGGGKTTLLRAILRLMPIAEGEVRIFGAPPSPPLLAREVGYLPQRSPRGQALPIAVEDMVLLGRRPAWLTMLPLTRDERRVAAQALSVFSMEAAARRLFHELSLGQQQRVLLARLISRPGSLLLLDEPDTGLDPEGLSRLYSVLAAEAAQGRTVLMITHDVGAVAETVSWVACINRDLIHAGAPADTDFHEMVHLAWGEKATPLHHAHGDPP